MKKRLLMKLGLVAVLGTGLFVAWLLLSEPTRSICNANFEKIQVGMTRKDVEYIFGSPPGDYGPGRASFIHPGVGGEVWLAGNRCYYVYFESDVVAAKLEGSCDRNEDWKHTLRRWLHLD